MSLYYYDHLTFGIYHCKQPCRKQMIETAKIGTTALIDNNRYYTIRIDSIPNKTFYLIRNNKKSGEYLIFEKKLTPFKFDRLAGYGNYEFTSKNI